jgi:hypothetical protein
VAALDAIQVGNAFVPLAVATRLARGR